MAERIAQAVWHGNLKDGTGMVKVGSGSFEGSYSVQSRAGRDRQENLPGLQGVGRDGSQSHGPTHRAAGRIESVPDHTFQTSTGARPLLSADVTPGVNRLTSRSRCRRAA
jgi:hypothetical protein